jgi:hypothetical protein
VSLALTNIPAIMRHHNWRNAARLMEIWFSRPSAVAPAYSAADTRTIRIDAWALTFSRARQVYDQIIREKIWFNAAGQREIGAMLRRQGALTGTGRSFGNLSRPVQAQDRDYINQRVVDFGLGDLDDMSASLGRFTFRVLVAGRTTAVRGSSGAGGTRPPTMNLPAVPRSATFQVSIAEVGIYIRDSFDFNGDQFLGFWDDSDNSVSMLNFLSGTSVSNEDFRNWRARHGRGGDFLVFSDIKCIALGSPDTFYL